MIEINLLPEELRKKKTAFTMPDITLAFLPILIGLIGCLILTQILLVLTINIKEAAYVRMSKEYEVLQPQKGSIEVTWKDNIKVKREVDAIESLRAKRILWSKKLNQLSDLIVPGTWFTRLSVEKRVALVEQPRQALPQRAVPGIKKAVAEKTRISYLCIEGAASTLYGEELATIGRFIDRLKNDTEFFKDFSNIELDSTELYTVKDTEVMKFNISCYFKETDKE